MNLILIVDFVDFSFVELVFLPLACPSLWWFGGFLHQFSGSLGSYGFQNTGPDEIWRHHRYSHRASRQLCSVLGICVLLSSRACGLLKALASGSSRHQAVCFFFLSSSTHFSSRVALASPSLQHCGAEQLDSCLGSFLQTWNLLLQPYSLLCIYDPFSVVQLQPICSVVQFIFENRLCLVC